MMTKSKRMQLPALLASLSFLVPLVGAETVPEDLRSDWSLELEDGLPGWLRVAEKDGKPVVLMRRYVGPEGPHEVKDISDGKISFLLKGGRKSNDRKQGIQSIAEVKVTDGKLEGAVVRSSKEGKELGRSTFTGTRIPEMPPSAPDLSKVCFGHPVSIFNGRDMTGWRTYESDKINGWSVKDGLLVNTTTKTDFSATGSHANLRTEADYEDFWLHVEFLVEENQNSGIYLRGCYEAQVVDRDSRMQGISGVGAIFSRAAPSINAGRPGGEWQSYDLTLVDRHITVVLNGVTVIDNQPISAPTPGAINTDPSAPGPIYLQGDHTIVKYRSMYISPVISKD